MKTNDNTDVLAVFPLRAVLAFLGLLGFGCVSQAQLASTSTGGDNHSCANTVHFLFNIFVSPELCRLNEFHFTTNAVWTPRENGFCDVCSSYFEPQPGPGAPNEFNAHGNPAVAASVSASNNVIQITWAAVPEVIYRVQYTTNLHSEHFTTATPSCALPFCWMNLTNIHVLAAETSARVLIPWTNHPNVSFRIERLSTPLID